MTPQQRLVNLSKTTETLRKEHDRVFVGAPYADEVQFRSMMRTLFQVIDRYAEVATALQSTASAEGGATPKQNTEHETEPRSRCCGALVVFVHEAGPLCTKCNKWTVTEEISRPVEN